jgi:hypothetical protein
MSGAPADDCKQAHTISGGRAGWLMLGAAAVVVVQKWS